MSNVANDMANRLLARIKQLREANGLTQEAFAEKVGLAYKYYQHVEAGRRRDIRLSTLVKMADGLGLTLSQLVDFNFSPPVAIEEKKGSTKLASRVSVPKRRPAPKQS